MANQPNQPKNSFTIPADLPSTGTIIPLDSPAPVVPPLKLTAEQSSQVVAAATNFLAPPTVPGRFLPDGMTEDRLRELEIRKLMLEVEQMEEQAGVKRAKAEQLRAQRIQNAMEIKKRLAEQKRQQAHCPHLKQNGKANTAGQRDAHGNYIIFCQHHNCQKTWHSGPNWTNEDKYNPERYPNGDTPLHPRGLYYSDTLPVHLYPDGETIGGPQQQ